ncbi:unnamed protein product [Linum tenue]|uniref:Chaperone protein dnaJ 1, mitochondrial n=1 Tax=Linum tenue TaxID=586396 RepID=A0AAV0MPB7_9ROSI|nr:unnamed protein product [Linum tenue]
MGRYSWHKLCRLHFLSSTAVEAAGNGGYSLRRITTLSPSNLPYRITQRYTSIGRPTGVGMVEIPLLQWRCFHATGSIHAKEQSYYEVLGVPQNASKEDIKRAFRVLAKKYHPDANKNNPSAQKKFLEIREAYETLQDPEKRAQYDMGFRSDADDATGFRYGASSAGNFRSSYNTDFSDSFRKIFSEIIFEVENDQISSDIQAEVVLSFSEAASGCTKQLSFDAHMACDSCDGRGYPANAETRLCPTCRGVGKVTIPPFTTSCSMCKGSGRIIKGHCKSCRGSGVVEGIKEVKVTIPAGVDSGDTIRVPAAGNFGGRRSQPGNLFIHIKVADDPLFTRDGADVYVDANISFNQAILGGEIEVPTLSGKTQVQIPRGVQHGQLLVLRRKGLPRHGFLVNHGDQYVRFRINLPTELNERQRAILEEFAVEEIKHENDTSTETDCFSDIASDWIKDPELDEHRLYQQLSTG